MENFCESGSCKPRMLILFPSDVSLGKGITVLKKKNEKKKNVVKISVDLPYVDELFDIIAVRIGTERFGDVIAKGVIHLKFFLGFLQVVFAASQKNRQVSFVWEKK